jgi:hypothetical protein
VELGGRLVAKEKGQKVKKIQPKETQTQKIIAQQTKDLGQRLVVDDE